MSSLSSRIGSGAFEREERLFSVHSDLMSPHEPSDDLRPFLDADNSQLAAAPTVEPYVKSLVGTRSRTFVRRRGDLGRNAPLGVFVRMAEDGLTPRRDRSSALEARQAPWFTDATTEVQEIARRCSRDDWDGEEEAAISEAVVVQALRMLMMLPNWCPRPDISPAPDGHLELDWDFGAKAMLAVSIGGKADLYYAALIDDTRMRGHEQVRFTLPEPLLLALTRLTRYVGARTR